MNANDVRDMFRAIDEADIMAKYRAELKAEFQIGFGLYCDGARFEDCQGNAQERGWWAALDAQIDAEMPASNEPGYDYQPRFGPQWA